MNQYSNIEAEQTILGSIITNNLYLARVIDFLESKHFFMIENQEIYKKITEVVKQSRVDQVTLADYFGNNEMFNDVGNKQYLGLLLSKASGIIDIRDYAKTVIEMWQKREMELLLNGALSDLGSNNFDYVSLNLVNDIVGLEVKESRQKTQTTTEILNEIEIEEEQQINSKFVATGFKSLDNLLNGGIYAQQLVILGARPAIGKTTFAQNVILNAAQKGKKCLFLSLEISKKSVMYKFLSSLTSLEYWRFVKKIFRQSDYESVIRAKKQIKKMQISVNDSSYLNINQINQIVKQQIQKNPVDLVVVDYVQIVKGDFSKNKNEASVIKEVTTSLKAIAKQYDVGVLALAQVNRQAVQSSKSEPTINDFKSSGGIEEDADVAIIMHRERVQDKNEGYFSKQGKLIVAKNRYGATGEVGIFFDGQFNRMGESDL